MKYRRLGSTDLHVCVIGIGTWQFGGAWRRDDTVPEVRTILDHTLTFDHRPTLGYGDVASDHLRVAHVGGAARDALPILHAPR